MLFGEEGADPAVLVGLCAETAVVLLCRDDLDFRSSGQVVAHGIVRSITNELARLEFVFDSLAHRPLFFGRKRAPEVLALGTVEMRYVTVMLY